MLAVKNMSENARFRMAAIWKCYDKINRNHNIN